MSVNDAELAQDAEGNCALCSVAGIRGTTARGERQAVQTAMGAVSESADFVFYEYAVRVMGQSRNVVGKATLRTQVVGVAGWMGAKGYTTSLIGSVDNPLQADALKSTMLRCANGTSFIYLLIEQGGEAHWITATKNGFSITYTDYQLDIRAGLKRYMARGRMGDVRRSAPWGAPSVTNEPREAWGGPSRDTNRMMAIVVRDRGAGRTRARKRGAIGEHRPTDGVVT